MIPEGTERRTCMRCHKVVLVARIQPCSNSFYLNAIWLTRMDENYDEHNVGALCFECAFCTDFGEPIFRGYGISLGFGGGQIEDLSNWEAILAEYYDGH